MYHFCMFLLNHLIVILIFFVTLFLLFQLFNFQLQQQQRTLGL